MIRTTRHTYNIHEAKTNLSKLLEQMENGEEIIIARAGVPLARLVPIVSPATERRLGTESGVLVIGDDFDAPMDRETLRSFDS